MTAIADLRVQHLAAANRARQNHYAVKCEIRAGTLTVADALHDPRAASLTVFAVVCAQRGWGVSRTRRLLAAMGVREDMVREDKRVDTLTVRQIAAVSAMLGDRRA